MLAKECKNAVAKCVARRLMLNACYWDQADTLQRREIPQDPPKGSCGRSRFGPSKAAIQLYCVSALYVNIKTSRLPYRNLQVCLGRHRIVRAIHFLQLFMNLKRSALAACATLSGHEIAGFLRQKQKYPIR